MLNRNGTYPMPSRAAILTSLGLPDPKPFAFEPLPNQFEEPSIKIGLEGYGAVVVNVDAATRLANAIRPKVLIELVKSIPVSSRRSATPGVDREA